METTTKKKAKKLTGQALFDHRMKVMRTSPIKITEKGRNVWNIKPYKD